MASNDLNRRAFLKFGAAATTIAGLKREGLFALVSFNHPMRAGQRLVCPPGLSDLASDGLSYQFGDLFNSSPAMNKFG